MSSQTAVSSRPSMPPGSGDGKRKLSAESATSPAMGPIQSMLIQVKLRGAESPRAKKRVRFGEPEVDRVKTIPSLQISGTAGKRLRKVVKRNQRHMASRPDGAFQPLVKRRRVSGHMSKITEKWQTHQTLTVRMKAGPSEMASALALASLALPLKKRPMDEYLLHQGVVQAREENETDRFIEDNQATRDVSSVPSDPTPSGSYFLKTTRNAKKGREASLPDMNAFDCHPNTYPFDQAWYRHSNEWNGFTHHNSVPVQSNTWICDFCHTASFAIFADACKHEEQCKLRFLGPDLQGEFLPPRATRSFDDNRTLHRNDLRTGIPSELQGARDREGTDDEGQSTLSKKASQKDSKYWHTGSVALSIEATDAEWLSELNCFTRNYCMEAFSATDDDISQTSKRGRIVLHQVGIRCKFCATKPSKERTIGAISYPTSIAGIYESAKRLQRVHLEACLDMPKEVKAKMTELQTSPVWVPTSRQYWADSARALGMVDTVEGIRFACDPRCPNLSVLETTKASDKAEACDSSVGDTSGSDTGYIVLPEDEEGIPPYVYFLMRQVQRCCFTEADRFVARSKGPIGFAGFQCRHCDGHAGLGKYFPVSPKSLSTNSTSQNIHAHVLKCRKCPEHVKEELELLKHQKLKVPGLATGWRRIFFDRVWKRLHG